MLFPKALLIVVSFVQHLDASPAHTHPVPKGGILKSSKHAKVANADELAKLEADYVLPTTGAASTTTFNIGSEFSQGTACGVEALPSDAQVGSSPGNGPGYLYAAFNQLAFGASYGPGPACGLCYSLTPVSAGGEKLMGQMTTFMIVDSCPANDSANKPNCGQCSSTAQNNYGKTFHFDIAVDAMSAAQYQTFYNGVSDGTNWSTVVFQKVDCDAEANTRPDALKDWGCMEDCETKETSIDC